MWLQRLNYVKDADSVMFIILSLISFNKQTSPIVPILKMNKQFTIL